ncbi:MAG: DinB family protein [Rubrivivax sp.]
MNRLQVRALAARDSMEMLTALLHRAYEPLRSQGFPEIFTNQAVEATRRCVAQGHCLVAERDGAVVGTVTLCGPHESGIDDFAGADPWLRGPDTARIVHFAVDPQQQGGGVGRRLLQASEALSRDQSYRRLAIEIAEPGTGLRAMFRHQGYVQVAQVQRPGRPYRTLILLKTFDRSPLREQLQLMARYHLWATRQLLRAVDALPEADYRRDVGLFFKSVHGTLNHMLLAEDRLWVPRFKLGQSPSIALDTEVEPDRAALHSALVEAVLAWLMLLEEWPEARLHGSLAYHRSDGLACELPFAPTLMHVFNHGTHHRGQVTAAITAMGGQAPELDLVRMLQEQRSLD